MTPYDLLEGYLSLNVWMLARTSALVLARCCRQACGAHDAPHSVAALVEEVVASVASASEPAAAATAAAAVPHVAPLLHPELDLEQHPELDLGQHPALDLEHHKALDLEQLPELKLEQGAPQGFGATR